MNSPITNNHYRFLNVLPALYTYEKASEPSTLKTSREQDLFMGDGSTLSLLKTIFLSVITLGTLPLYYLCTNDFDAQINEQLKQFKDHLKQCVDGDDQKINAIDQLTSDELKMIKKIIFRLQQKKDDIIALYSKQIRAGKCYTEESTVSLLDNGDVEVFVDRNLGLIFMLGYTQKLLIPTNILFNKLIENVDLSNKKLNGMILDNVDFQNKDMSGMILRNVSLSGAKFNGTNLKDTSITLRGDAIFRRVVNNKIPDLLKTVDSIDNQFIDLKINLLHQTIVFLGKIFKETLKIRDDDIKINNDTISFLRGEITFSREEWNDRIFSLIEQIVIIISQFTIQQINGNGKLKIIDDIINLLNETNFKKSSAKFNIRQVLIAYLPKCDDDQNKKVLLNLISTSTASNLIVNEVEGLNLLLTLIEKEGDGKSQFLSENCGYFIQLLELARHHGDKQIKTRIEKLNIAYETYTLLNELLPNTEGILPHLLMEAVGSIKEKSYLIKRSDYILGLIQFTEEQSDPELLAQASLLKTVYKEKLLNLLIKAVNKLDDINYVLKRSKYLANLVQLAEKQKDSKLTTLANLLKTA